MRFIRRCIVLTLTSLLLLGFGIVQRAQAQVESVLHSFTSGSDGGSPQASLIGDSSGNLYGTTSGGGSANRGTVFEMVYNSATGSYTEKVLYSFAGGTSDGSIPYGGLVTDSSGNLYGTTSGGGSATDGTVFELVYNSATGSYTEQVLYSFAGGTSDGAVPYAGLIMDSSGNLYGTTYTGGPANAGTVFELVYNSATGSYTEQLLYSFAGGTSDGAIPYGGLVTDSSGNLYGTTSAGGSATNGTVFELVYNSATNSYTEKVLYSFVGGTSDGAVPYAGLIMDSSGNLYGTTSAGGSAGDGTVFELAYNSATGSYTEKVLYGFAGGSSDGSVPYAGLNMDSLGNLYGTTSGGGSANRGTVFEMVYNSATGSYTEKVLYSFTGGNDGGLPYAGLVRDSSGNLYGTTSGGGSAYFGTVFGIALVTISPTSLSFGDVTVAMTSPAQTVTITNTGAGNLSFGKSSISGANAADFAIDANADTCSSQTVAAGSSCSIGVTFTPSATGSESASLNLIEGGISMTVSLAGTGALTTVGLSGTTLTFSTQPVGATSAPQTVTVTNTSTGTITLNVTAVSITSDFAIASNTCNNSVAAGSNCTVSVTFTPTAAGVRTGTLTFTDNAASSPQTVALSGTGAITTVSVVPATLSFGSQMVGTKSADQMVTVTNTGGTTSLAFSGISVSSNFVIDAAGTTCTTSTPVAPSGSCQVAVAFAPTTAGTLPGTLTFTDDASPTTQTVALSGTAEALSVNPASLTFGSTVVGSTSSAQTVTVANTGTSGITFSGFTTTGNFSVSATGTTCSTSAALAPSASCTVAVVFQPAAAGTLTGSLAIASSGGSGTVALSGTGTAPGVALSPSSLTFAGTLVGSTSAAQSVTLTNSGASGLTISSITVNDEFAIAAAGTTCAAGTTLAASSSCTIAVTFTPSAGGTRTGAVTISDNAGSSPQTVALSGSGEDFSLTAGATSQTVSPGGTATYSLQLSPQGGFNQAVSLACSGAPAHSTCTVTPASATLDGTSSTSVTVKVTTTAASMVGPGPGNIVPPSGRLPMALWLAIFGLLGLIALAGFSPRGGRVRQAAPWAALALLAALCAGCGGGSSSMTSNTSSNATPAGTYTLTVTATSGSLTRTSQVTMIVQ